jgi:hypothetical protein
LVKSSELNSPPLSEQKTINHLPVWDSPDA